MKTHSNNIRVSAGVLAVKGLNVFPELETPPSDVPLGRHWLKQFRTCLAQAAKTGETILAEAGVTYQGAPSLLALSIPQIEETPTPSNGSLAHFIVAGGLLTFGPLALHRGDEVYFWEDEMRCVVAEANHVTPTLTRGEFAEMQYDTYNATSLDEISDEILSQLEIPVDRAKLRWAYPDEEKGQVGWDENDDHGGMESYSMVKYLSVYAPDLKAESPAPALVYSELTDFRPFGGDLSADYDAVLVEFTDTTQPFGYVTIELAGQPVTVKTGELPQDDVYGRMFDASIAKDPMMARGGPEAAIKNLKALSQA